MERLVRVVAAYLNAQIAAGAVAVQLFDSWVGCLSPADYRAHVLPHVRALIAALTPGTPVIHFGTGTAGLLEAMRAAGGHVIGLDWRVDLDAAWVRLGHDVAVQGNLDPGALPAPPPQIPARAAQVLAAARALGFAVGRGNGGPYVPDSLARMGGDGVRSGVGVILSPHASGASRERYMEEVKAAGAGAPTVRWVGSLHTHPLFVTAVAD